MLRDKDLERQREIQNKAMPDTCIRKRKTYQSDGKGGQEVTSVSEETFSCRVSRRQQALPREYLRLDLAGARNPKLVTLPYGTDVVRTDVLEVNGEDMEVIGVVSTREWETAVRCVCEVLE